MVGNPSGWSDNNLASIAKIHVDIAPMSLLGDTLVIDTVGFNERFWIHRDGFPHTEAMHLIERISRPNVDTLNYVITIDDPLAYDAPWSTSWSKEWTYDEEFIESGM